MLLDLLVLADLHGAASVRTLSLKFIVENGKEIVSQVSLLYSAASLRTLSRKFIAGNGKEIVSQVGILPPADYGKASL